MMSKDLSPELLRVCDANLNRLREGIRVIEDILRYSFNDKTNASKLKNLRHKTKLSIYKELLQTRDATNDVLKTSSKSEQTRASLESVMIANFKRAEESARVLEEILKLHDTALSELFKSLRYELYTIEKEVML